MKVIVLLKKVKIKKSNEIHFNTKDKTIQLEEDFTKVEISELFDILDIENIDEYRILTKTKDFWSQTNTYYPKIQSYSTDNTFDNNLKVVYKNIVDSL